MQRHRIQRMCFGHARVSFLLLLLLALMMQALKPPKVQAQATNLITNGDFEAGGTGWQGCGDIAVVDGQQPGVSDAMVYGGRYAARVSYNAALNCGGDAFFSPESQIAQQINIPADAPAVTVSFRYSRVGATQIPMRVILGTEARPLGWIATLDSLEPEDLSGWNLYRGEVRASELERVRGKTLYLYLACYVTPGTDQPPVTSTDPPGYYLDDVRVVAATERTQESPLPAALQSDGTRPLVLIKGGLGVARMNTDGSDPQQLPYQGRINRALTPTWSSDGTKIAVLESWLTPEENNDVTVNPAFITLVTAMDANGNNPREVYRTDGLPGKYRVPNDPVNPNRSALDVEISALDWSPDNRALALSICARNRDYDGASSDPICFVEVREVATGNKLYEFEQVFRARWNGNNRLIVHDNDNYGERADGIWEIDLSTNPPTETRLVEGTGAPFDPSFATERQPTWSPDGTQFATVRDVSGYHFDANDDYVFHKAIMLYNRNSPVGRQVLVLDHGTSPTNLTWSPDGKYILYDLSQGEAVDIWWLDMATGATGKVTNDGASIAAEWRPVCTAGSACNGTYTVYVPLVRR